MPITPLKRKVTEEALLCSNTGALGVSGIKVGDKSLAKGQAPNGETGWFQAEVIGLKQAQSSPSIFIKYTKTIDGCMDQQALPCPQYGVVFKVDRMVAREDAMVVAPVVVAASSSVGQVALCEPHGWQAPTQMLEQCPTTGGGETTDEDDEARVAATRGRTYTQSRLVFGVCACTQHPPLTTNPHH